MRKERIQALSGQARRAVPKKDWTAVETSANAILLLDPDSAEGHFLLGMAQSAHGRPLRATESFSRALELDPDRYDAAIELANQYCTAQRNGEAAALVDRYAGRLSNSPRYLDMAGTVYAHVGLYEKAWRLYERANVVQPGVDLFRANLAACAVYLGKFDQAREIYQALLRRYPAHQRNHYHLSRLERVKDDGHLRQMLELLNSLPPAPDRNIFLYYAIGKELEDLERWDEAFEYYRRAGEAVRGASQYDVSEDIAIIDAVISECSAQWLRTPAPGAARDRTPLFIVGLPRTGTTLTERILSSHSRVESIGETMFIQMVLRRESGLAVQEAMTPEMVRVLAGKDMSRLAQGYLDAVRYKLGDKPMFIDKLPFNFLYLGFIARAFPEARIVHLMRNPLDACFAMYKQLFTFAYKFSYRLEDLGRYYVAYERLRRHWQDVLGSRFVEVAYEDLVSDQEAQTRSLLERLHLDFEPACLEFEKNKAPSATASSVQVREKMHSRSVARWRRFEKHLAPLRDQLAAAGIPVE